MSVNAFPVVGRKYALISKLGQGAMADVYLGLHEGVQGFAKLAVVKLLRGHLAEDRDFVERFLEEGRLSMRLAHPNIVQTYEVGQDATSYYLAMEFLQGQTLASILNRCSVEQTEFDFACAGYVLAEVLAAMEYAHELADYDGTPLRVVHRDLSPPNIFVTYDGQVKVLDFGIAKALDTAVETKTGLILGKTRYMSPEQARGETLDCRADLYAIGVMLWEAVARRRRWTGLNDPDIVRELVTSDVVELPGAAQHGLPDRLDEIVALALAPNPNDRFQSAAQFRNALEEVLRDLQHEATGRSLGRIVATMFQTERSRLEREIQLKVGKLERADLGGPVASSVDGDAMPAPVRPDDGTSIAPLTTGAMRISGGTSRFRLGGYVWQIAVTLCLLALGVLIGWSEIKSRRAAKPQAAASAQQLRVTIRLSAVPTQANLYLDGARLGGNPASIERVPDERPHELKAEAPGYRTEVRTLVLSRDLEVQLQLRPEPEEVSAPAPPEPTPPPTKIFARTSPRSKVERLTPPPEPRATTTAASPENVEKRPEPTPSSKLPDPSIKLDPRNPWR